MQTVTGEVFPDSYAYIHTASSLAQNLFFYPLCTGYTHFRHYCISRSSFDSFLIMLVTEGSLFLRLGDREYLAKAGDAVLLDCYAPHSYGTREECRLLWVHFDGPQARAYYDLAAADGPIIRPAGPHRFHHTLKLLLELFRRKESRREAELSCIIVQLLTELIDRPQSRRGTDAVELAAGRIAEDPAAPLTLEALADYISLSPYYLCRRFREKMGVSPHEYLLQVRVDRARYLLKFTDLPLKEVAEQCGFSNPSSFSATFRRLTGTTPLTCRRADGEGPLPPAGAGSPR